VSFRAEEKNLLDDFGTFGTIVDSRFLNTQLGRFRGMVTITYENKQSAEKAIRAKNKSTFLDRTIFARFDTMHRGERLVLLDE